MPKISLAFSPLFLFLPPLQTEIRWERKRKETVLRYILTAECFKLVLLLFPGLLSVIMFFNLRLRPVVLAFFFLFILALKPPHISVLLRSSQAVFMVEDDRKSQHKWHRDYNQLVK